jgi:hypothetical protein
MYVFVLLFAYICIVKQNFGEHKLFLIFTIAYKEKWSPSGNWTTSDNYIYICIVIRYPIIRGATIFVPGPILELDFQCDISDGVFYVQLFVVRLGCSCC